MPDAFVLGGARTPVGRYGGSLSHLRTDDLLGQTMVAACERVGVALDQIEDISAGCVNPAHEGMGDVGRWAALAAGFPDSVAGVTINRYCGSSLSATVNVAHAIKAGDLVVVDGSAGTVVLHPEPETLIAARRAVTAFARERQRFAKLRRLPAETQYDAVHQAAGSRPRLPGARRGTMAAQLVDRFRERDEVARDETRSLVD